MNRRSKSKQIEEPIIKIIGNTRLFILTGDITSQNTDAIVNAANSSLMGGGGVDGAIHRAGGPIILEECKIIISEIGRLDTGKAVITSAGNMPARHVIHTVGPIWRGGDKGEELLLESAYRESIHLAFKHNLKSISFPSISTGAYRYPVADAARTALRTVASLLLEEGASLEVVKFVLYDSATYNVYSSALADIS